MARIAKTGMAARMRDWMKVQKRPFTRDQLCRGVGLAEGDEHQRATNAFRDFEARGEIARCEQLQQNRRQNNNALKYQYNHAWKRADRGRIKPRILKAIYLSMTPFTVADIQRISGAPEKSLVTKTVTRLSRGGYLAEVGKDGLWKLYKVTDREKFKIELL